MISFSGILSFIEERRSNLVFFLSALCWRVRYNAETMQERVWLSNRVLGLPNPHLGFLSSFSRKKDNGVVTTKSTNISLRLEFRFVSFGETRAGDQSSGKYCEQVQKPEGASCTLISSSGRKGLPSQEGSGVTKSHVYIDDANAKKADLRDELCRTSAVSPR